MGVIVLMDLWYKKYMPDFENTDEGIVPDVTQIFHQRYRQTYDADLSMIPNYGVVAEEWRLWQDRGNIVNPDFVHIDPMQGDTPDVLPEGVTSLSDWRADNPDWA